MRVLILVHGYPPLQTGGAERRAARTAQHLAQRGHEVMVLAVHSVVDAPPDAEMHDVMDGDVRVRRIRLTADRSPTAFQTSYLNPQAAAATAQALDDFSPHVVHHFSGYLMSAGATSAALDRGFPVVVSLTDYWWLCHRITLTRTNHELCSGPTPVDCARCQAESGRRYRLPAEYAPRLVDTFWKTAATRARLGTALGVPEQIARSSYLMSVLNRCDAFVSPSQYLADTYIRHGADASRMKVWRQGVDVNHCVMRREDEALRFGCLGQVKSHKGVDVLVEAWKKLSGSRPRHLYIFGSADGEPEYGAAIRQEVEAMPDASWPGEYRGAEVWDIVSNLDALVIPSRWVENSPNSILEAQAVGLPVIASNLGALPEMVHHGGNGLLFNVDDPDDLAAQMQRMLDEPDLVPRLRSGALPFKTIADEIDELCELYESLATVRV